MNVKNEKIGYPFVNPIIVTKDMGIVDGQHRYMVCEQEKLPVESITIPFTLDELKSKACIDHIKSIKRKQSKKLEKYFKKNKVGFLDQIDMCSSEDRIENFYKFRNKFRSDKQYWKQLANAYTMSQNNYKNRNKLRELFNSKRSNRESLMTTTERMSLHFLGIEVTIYRGMSIEEFESVNFGISWTLDKKVAEKYGEKFLHNYDTIHLNHEIKEMTIDKNDIVAYFNGRNEKEIIYLG